MKKYSISKAASILGLSQSSLRYYEQRGVLKIEREENGKYRNFGHGELMILQRCQIYLQYGFSIEEICSLLGEEIPEKVAEILEKQQKKMEEELRLKEAILQYSREQSALLKRLVGLLSQCVVEKMPALLLSACASYPELENRHSNPWFRPQYAPFTESSMCCFWEAEGLKKEFYMSIPAAYEEILQIQKEDVLLHLPQRDCVVSAIPMELHAGLLQEAQLQHMFAFAAAAGLSVENRIYLRSLHISCAKGRDRAYAMAYLPILS